MEIQIKPHYKNEFPLGGILIKDISVANWIREIQSMGFVVEEVKIYPIPGTTANSIWGCLVRPFGKINKDFLRKNEACQLFSQNLLIPEKTTVYPTLTNIEVERLFSAQHVFHPDFGLVELTEELVLKDLIKLPEEKSYYVTKPIEGAFVPSGVKSFQVSHVSPEEVLKNMEENIFPKKEKIEDKPLNPFEKVKLEFYKFLFKKTESKDGDPQSENSSSNPGAEKPGWMSKLESFFKINPDNKSSWSSKMQKDFEDLERRNQKEIDKLMNLFKNDPIEALKYAIPLDDGSNRGGENKKLDLSKRWGDFSLFNQLPPSQSGGGSTVLGDYYYQLQKQYNETAELLIKQREYQKAAFVYMKLLKDYYKAAETLELGNHFQEAATIWLKHANNKNKAAECYLKGNMISDAIELYKELNENEKVGDLYIKIYKRKEANVYFGKVIDKYKESGQYVKASLIYKDKMNDPQGGQLMLIEGWRENKDAFNCLNNYFNNIEDLKDLNNEINSVYKTDVNEQNREIFLKAIWHEFKKKNELSEPLKEIAYEIIATHLSVNPSIVAELKMFNIDDKELVKDTARFSMNWKKYRK